MALSSSFSPNFQTRFCTRHADSEMKRVKFNKRNVFCVDSEYNTTGKPIWSVERNRRNYWQLLYRYTHSHTEIHFIISVLAIYELSIHNSPFNKKTVNKRIENKKKIVFLSILIVEHSIEN